MCHQASKKLMHKEPLDVDACTNVTRFNIKKLLMYEQINSLTLLKILKGAILCNEKLNIWCFWSTFCC